MIQDTTVNQYQHIIFITISKQLKSISTFCNSIQILETHNYDSDLIAIMTPQKGVGITPAYIIISIKKRNQLFMYRNVMTEMSPDQNGQTEKSRTQPTNCVSRVTRSVELMTCTTQAGFILQVYFTLVIRSFSHISHTAGGQPKREEMHQVTGRPAQRILLSVF